MHIFTNSVDPLVEAQAPFRTPITNRIHKNAKYLHDKCQSHQQPEAKSFSRPSSFTTRKHRKAVECDTSKDMGPTEFCQNERCQIEKQERNHQLLFFFEYSLRHRSELSSVITTSKVQVGNASRTVCWGTMLHRGVSRLCIVYLL
jgi:hypothetical protein